MKFITKPYSGPLTPAQVALVKRFWLKSSWTGDKFDEQARLLDEVLADSSNSDLVMTLCLAASFHGTNRPYHGTRDSADEMFKFHERFSAVLIEYLHKRDSGDGTELEELYAITKPRGWLENPVSTSVNTLKVRDHIRFTCVGSSLNAANEGTNLRSVLGEVSDIRPPKNPQYSNVWWLSIRPIKADGTLDQEQTFRFETGDHLVTLESRIMENPVE